LRIGRPILVPELSVVFQVVAVIGNVQPEIRCPGPRSVFQNFLCGPQKMCHEPLALLAVLIVEPAIGEIRVLNAKLQEVSKDSFAGSLSLVLTVQL
jgi:hypothetical protein